MKDDRDYVLRFAVVAEDGRRSSTWRVWTGSKRPTNDVYVAPRDTQDFKISLHKDGYYQHGPNESLRKKLRPEDRQAFDRWDEGPEIAPGLKIAYSMWFVDSELRHYDEPLEASVVQVPADLGGQVTAVTVCTVETYDQGELDWGEIVPVGYLSRSSRGLVAVVATSAAGGQEAVREAKAMAQAPGQVWATPRNVHDDSRVAYAFTGSAPGVAPRVLEFTIDKPLATRQGVLYGEFKGRVRQWDERPTVAVGGPDACAILVVPRGVFRRPSLYVDEQARCDHFHLADDANRLVTAVRNGKIDAGWNRLRDGSYMTWIMPRSAGERVGGGYDTPR